ncbi:hypothetical protein Ms3S1_14190 [Methylosinus sp. 3S-1]
MEIDSPRERLTQLQRNLPLPARGRPALLSFLRAHAAEIDASACLWVTEIFDAGEKLGVMCRIAVANRENGSFIAPFSHVAVSRKGSRRRRASFAETAGTRSS